MECPVCDGVDLLMADRQGIEIDHCPQCRGVWLDHGELGKIIEHTHEEYVHMMEPMAAQPMAAQPQQQKNMGSMAGEALNAMAMMKMMKGGKSGGDKKMGLGGILKGL